MPKSASASREERKSARTIVHLRRFDEHPAVPEPHDWLEQAMRKRGGKCERLLEMVPRRVVEPAASAAMASVGYDFGQSFPRTPLPPQ